jgi:Uma2 family endonuclease
MEKLSQPPRRFTVEEYFQLEETARDRHEFHDGVIVAMAGGSPEHSLIIMNVGGELRSRLKGCGCSVYDSNLRLQLARQRRYSYADAAVICGEAEIVTVAGTGKVCVNPRLVVEVLSETTEAYDRTTKFDRYREIESFQEYVLVSQTTPRVETYFRHPDGGWRIDFAIGLDSKISLRSVPAELPLSEIYAGITFPAPTDADAESDIPPPT